jgi:hypothetical protein
MISLRRMRVFSLALAATLALGLTLGSGVGQAELAKWDQERVAALAEQFADAVGGVYQSISRKRTGAQVGSGQASAFMRLRDTLRLARSESRHLSKSLADGKSLEETQPVYRRLMTLIRDAREDGRKMFLEEPTLDQIAKAGDLLRQLSPYYDPDANANPNLE